MKKVCAEFVFQEKISEASGKAKTISVYLTVFYGSGTYSILPNDKTNNFNFVGSSILEDTVSHTINLLFQANEFAKKELASNA